MGQMHDFRKLLKRCTDLPGFPVLLRVQCQQVDIAQLTSGQLLTGIRDEGRRFPTGVCCRASRLTSLSS